MNPVLFAVLWMVWGASVFYGVRSLIATLRRKP